MEAPIRYRKVSENTGVEVPFAEIGLVYTTEKGVQVPLTDDEIAVALGHANGACDVIGFFPNVELADGRYLVVSRQQVRPQTVKSGSKTVRPYDKAFTLLTKALEVTNRFALLRYTLHGTTRLGALTADGTLHVLAWEDQVRDTLPMPGVEVNDAEVAMAVTLVETLAADDAPRLENEGVQAVRTYAETKAAGLPQPEQAVASTAVVDDLMAALAASVEAAKAA
jgi:DNA end-binding protein Ku